MTPVQSDVIENQYNPTNQTHMLSKHFSLEYEVYYPDRYNI